MVDGMTQQLIEEHKNLFSGVFEKLANPEPMPIVVPGFPGSRASTLGVMLYCPMFEELDSSFRKTKKIREKKKADKAAADNGANVNSYEKIAVEVLVQKAVSGNFLLDTLALKLNKFPLIESHEEASRVRVAPEAAPEEKLLVGLDCEMVRCVTGMQMARMSLVDHDDTVLCDILIKPHDEILDYNTEFSGITAEMLADVVTTLQEGQEEFFKFVSK